MTLSPQDIVRKEFREALRGYNQADVDLFLDEVVEEFTRLSEENQKMKVRLAALQQEVARLRDGRLGAPAPGASGGVGKVEDAARVEAEVRARVRRFLEDQLRMVEDGPSATVERIAREVPPPPPRTAEADTKPSDTPAKGADHEPFWAGE
jgi:cell division initiation protein